MKITPNKLVNDAYIADMLSVSKAWVRKQRMLRNNNEEHILTIDPIYIGSKTVRYKESDVHSLIASFSEGNGGAYV